MSGQLCVLKRTKSFGANDDVAEAMYYCTMYTMMMFLVTCSCEVVSISLEEEVKQLYIFPMPFKS